MCGSIADTCRESERRRGKGLGTRGAHLPMPLISGISLARPVPTVLTQLPSYFFSSFVVVYRDTAHPPWLDSPRVVSEE